MFKVDIRFWIGNRLLFIRDKYSGLFYVINIDKRNLKKIIIYDFVIYL